jgi:hypothetical protein
MFDRVDEITAQLMLKPIVFGLFFAVIFSIAISFGTSRREYLKLFLLNARLFIGYSIPVVLLGYVSGYLTGISRTAAVGNLIPAVLTIVGGLIIYLFRTKSDHNIGSIGFSVSVFALSIFYGIQVGAFQREYRQVDRFMILADQEKKIRDYRLNLELPTDPPNWITGIHKD